jgi:hypothetical protein
MPIQTQGLIIWQNFSKMFPENVVMTLNQKTKSCEVKMKLQQQLASSIVLAVMNLQTIQHNKTAT